MTVPNNLPSTTAPVPSTEQCPICFQQLANPAALVAHVEAAHQQSPPPLTPPLPNLMATDDPLGMPPPPPKREGTSVVPPPAKAARRPGQNSLYTVTLRGIDAHASATLHGGDGAPLTFLRDEIGADRLLLDVARGELQITTSSLDVQRIAEARILALVNDPEALAFFASHMVVLRMDGVLPPLDNGATAGASAGGGTISTADTVSLADMAWTSAATTAAANATTSSSTATTITSTTAAAAATSTSSSTPTPTPTAVDPGPAWVLPVQAPALAQSDSELARRMMAEETQLFEQAQEQAQAKAAEDAAFAAALVKGEQDAEARKAADDAALATRLRAEEAAAQAEAERKRAAQADEDASAALHAQHAEGVFSGAFQCCACMDDYQGLGDGIMPPCGHVLCRECFERMATTQMDQKQTLQCFDASCKAKVPGWLIDRVFGPERAEEYAAIEALHFAEVPDLPLRHCPVVNCDFQFIMAENFDPETQRLLKCPGCDKNVCLACEVEEHEGYSCEQYQKWKEENSNADAGFEDLFKKGLVKPCPNCHRPIMKNEGCNFITCAQCHDRNGFCWHTGKPRHGPNGCGGGHNCH